jgi:ankyrin repeat protein
VADGMRCQTIMRARVVVFGALILVGSCTMVNEPSPEPADQLTAGLVAAVSANRTADVRDLLTQGANPDSIHTPTHGHETALGIAARGGYVETARMLLDKHAHVNMRSGSGIDGLTPLMLAGHEGHVEMAVLLLDAGADVHMRTGLTGTGNTALRIAAARNHIGVVHRLLGAGAIVQPRDLMTALNGGHVEIVEAMLEAGADPFGPLPGGNAPGSTPLQVASRLEQPARSQMVELLSRFMGSNTKRQRLNTTERQ